MNAAVVTTFDAPPSYGTFIDPVANGGEKLVTVAAAGLSEVEALWNSSEQGTRMVFQP